MRSFDISVPKLDAFDDAMRIIRNVAALAESATPETAEVVSNSISDLLNKIAIPALEAVEEILDATP